MNVYKTENIGTLIKGNPYVGRGIIAGLSEDGRYAVGAYFIMGRSANSRNRIFAERDGAVFTEPFDPSKVEDPSLIIYAAVREHGSDLIITNGDQTDTIVSGLEQGLDFSGSLRSRCFEPDAPNLTPRISAMLCLGGDYRYDMSILKSIDEDGSDCARYTFSYPAKRGLGHFIHTSTTILLFSMDCTSNSANLKILCVPKIKSICGCFSNILLITTSSCAIQPHKPKIRFGFFFFKFLT